MKSVVFKSLLIVSHVLKKARLVEFGEVTVVTGNKNTTGKSSILKSLYYTLGANVVFEDEWIPLDTKTVLEFTFDGKQYTSFRDGPRITFFDSEGKVLISTDSITKELAPFVANLFDFNLPLIQSSTNSESQAIPAFLYLPFYVDQDLGWGSYFASFTGLQMFSRWQAAFKNYHTGIRPREFYTIGNQIKTERRNERDLGQEAEILTKTKQKVEKSLDAPGIVLDIEELRKQLQPLLEQLSSLLDNENVIRGLSARNVEERWEVTRQMKELREQVQSNEKELSEAEKFSEVVCPRCGSIHESKLYHEYALTSDTNDASDFLKTLESELDKLDKELITIEEQYQAAREQTVNIQREIAGYQAEISLQEVLQTVARKRAEEVFDAELKENGSKQETVAKTIIGLELEKKKLLDKRRSKKIKDAYISALGTYFQELSVESADLKAYRTNFTPPTTKLKTGSIGARQMLALYYAFIDTVYKFSTTTKFPIVVDSPKQQEQDSLNADTIATFCTKNRPASAQLILATLNYSSTDSQFKVYQLNDKKGLLEDLDYQLHQERIHLLNSVVLEHLQTNLTSSST